MLLSAGDRLGPYEVTVPIGAGGMGQVYQAQDTRLKRVVAIKILPPAPDQDGIRQRRFIQEARAVAALSHPNIAAIYDIAFDSGIDFIVMEYVSGKPLNELAANKALDLPIVLRYAVQISEALGAAHSAGIIHRDIKPANIVVTAEGVVKVLDFGLAKREERPQADESTRTLAIDAVETGTGAVVGTIAYMSPEQARGEKADRRSDIFSFGVVLYELISGMRAFNGRSAIEILSAILKEDPKPLHEIYPGVPRELERIVERCLRKQAGRRYQCIDDVRIDLQDVNPAEARVPAIAGATAMGRRAFVWPAVSALLAIALAAVLWFLVARAKTPEPLLSAFPLTTYPGSERSASFSPDGRQVAFAWDGEKQDNFDIYVKLIGFGAPLRITHDPSPDFFPAWSPDGRWIAFMRLMGNNRAAIMLVPPLGGPERKLTEVDVYTQVAYVQGVRPPRVSWSPDSTWLVIVDRASASEPFGLFAVSVASGDKHRLTTPPSAGTTDSGPAVSPDGKTVVYTRSTSNVGVGDLYSVRLSAEMKAEGEPARLTLDNRQNGHPAWTADGTAIVFSSPRNGGIFGLWRIPASGSAEPKRLASVGEGALFPAISLQGNHLAYTKYALDSNIWRVGAQAGEPRGAVIASTRQDVMPAYSPDGGKVAFSSDRSGYFQIWICDPDGSNPVQLTNLNGTNFHAAWSPDGQRIVFQSTAEGTFNLYVINAGGGTPKLLTTSAGGGEWPSFSSDGKWIYFASARSGRQEIWKTPAERGDAVQVTFTGGDIPRESRDGKYLFYMARSTTGPLMRVPGGGGTPVQVIEEIAARGYELTDRGIYYVAPPRTGILREYYEVNANNTLEFLDFATGKSRVIAQVAKPLQLGITVSPDGKWLLYPQIDQVVEDLMLVENFR